MRIRGGAKWRDRLNGDQRGVRTFPTLSSPLVKLRRALPSSVLASCDWLLSTPSSTERRVRKSGVGAEAPNPLSQNVIFGSGPLCVAIKKNDKSFIPLLAGRYTEKGGPLLKLHEMSLNTDN